MNLLKLDIMNCMLLTFVIPCQAFGMAWSVANLFCLSLGSASMALKCTNVKNSLAKVTSIDYIFGGHGLLLRNAMLQGCNNFTF